MLLARTLTLLLAGTALAAPVDFAREVQPILSEKCYHCHGLDPESRKAKLRLDLRDEAIRERDGVRAIVPGQPDQSELMVRILSKDPDEVMPPPKEHHALSAAEAATLRRWIAEGAEYAAHWAFTKPVPPPVPVLQRLQGEVRNPIDAFIGRELEKQGLDFAPPADPHILARRLALDLTGLPPSAHAATDPDALLASPAYGEKWARMWLDLARYADSTGYGSDKFRLNVWPWRDWLVGALNRNLPYDQFTLEVLAGDLLPNATPEQISATAFHRNTMTNVEGGTNDEEYRVAAVKDRVAVTGQVWMGLTVGCAQCHTHKFDPITLHDYYAMFAIFNQTEDADREDEAPRLPLPTPEQSARQAKLREEIAALEAKAKEITPEFEAEMHEWSAQATLPVKWTPLEAGTATTRQGQLAPQPDGSLLAPAQLADAEKYTVTVRPAARRITALRLEVLPEAEGRPLGRAGGNAVLSEVQLTVAPLAGAPVRGRFVRIAHDRREFLQLAEVQVFAGGENVAPKGQATQSSTFAGAQAGRAIDGNTDGIYEKGSVAHTNDGDPAPWWEVDLGAEVAVEKIVLWNRAELPQRIAGATLTLLDAQRQTRFRQTLGSFSPQAEFDPRGGARLELAEASADFGQSGREVGKAIDGNLKSGWGFAPQVKQPHTAVFVLKQPLDLRADEQFTITLRQEYGKQHNLARFRLSSTDAAEPPPILPAAIAATLALEPSERSPEQRVALADYFRPRSKTQAGLNAELKAKRDALAKIRPVELPIMRERAADQRRTTHILNKGNFQSPGEVVQPAVLSAFHPAPPGEVNRLALARWLVSPENPLTARVAVNRLWAQLFGTGLVETEEDFGTQGQLPSHPELLDWLALDFQRDWDVKRLLRLIVTSRTYQQSSRASAAARERDPRNRLLSHYPRRRLEAETVRDQALALSGLLSRKMGGPSVYPPQPEGLWSVAFNGGQNSYPTSQGEDRYRRGLYTFWRRTAHNPTMATFDAPSRETCTVRRVPTNTPLQAFVTLNDPVFVECAQALARRLLREGGEDLETRLRWGLELCLARPATAAQLAPLRELYERQLATFRQDAAAARQLAGELPAGLDPAEAAAFTAVANVLLNLDGVLMKN
jgi:hypothetical protein